LLDDEDKAQ